MAGSQTLPERLADCTMAIVGLGLMGGSLALALRGRCRRLLGIDPDSATLTLAEKMYLADELEPRSEDLLEQADLIVLAAPVQVILSLLGELPNLHSGPAIVLDLGSTKAQICAAMDALPERFEAVGGHPMGGKERSSLQEAQAEVYREAPFALVRTRRSTPRACRLAEELAFAADARPLWLDADTHDRWTAATSHLPCLVANALAAITPVEAAPMVGPGFRSTTRVAVTPTNVILDVLQTNRDNVLARLHDLRNRLALIEGLLEDERYTELVDALLEGASHYQALVEKERVARQP